jgi:hypothetical protein
MQDEPKPGFLREIAEAFKLGSGVLGKSAIAIGILIVVGGVAVYRLKSDEAILIAFGGIILAFFLWFFPVIVFVSKHPDAALLEGAEWIRFQSAAKGYFPTTTTSVQAPLQDDHVTTIVVSAPKPEEGGR